MQPHATRRTKLVCTLGPATDRPGVLASMLRAGMNVARVNTAHGTPPEHRRRIHQVRHLARRFRMPLAILVDLPGPKHRLGTVSGGAVALVRDSDVVLCSARARVPGGLVLPEPRLLRSLRVGHPVYLAEGAITLIVTRVRPSRHAPRWRGSAAPRGGRGRPGRVFCRVAVGGTVRSGSGVHAPESTIPVTLPTPDDLFWMAFACAQRVEWVGVSFVGTAEELQRVRRTLHRQSSGPIPLLMAKIEKRQALAHVEAIIGEADGVMVARGDLGMESPLAEVPMVQKRIIRQANEVGKPVVTATQMLDSMVDHPSPTRAEVSDVANAVLDGSDALMLSAETAMGAYPVEAVRVLSAVIEATELHYPYGVLQRLGPRTQRQAEDALSAAACRVAFETKAKAIVVMEDAHTAVGRIARFRPSAPVIALSQSLRRVQQLALVWGVQPFKPSAHVATSFANACAWLVRHRIARRGERVVVVSAVHQRAVQISEAVHVAVV